MSDDQSLKATDNFLLIIKKLIGKDLSEIPARLHDYVINEVSDFCNKFVEEFTHDLKLQYPDTTDEQAAILAGQELGKLIQTI